MLTINATLENDKIVLKGLRELADEMPETVERGLTRVVRGIHREAFDLLSGSSASVGGYPVPIITGNLRRLLDWLKPGASKDGFTAGPLEAVVYNSAEYARTIHEGWGSSAKFGARPYLTDAFKRFNQGEKAAEIVMEEIDKDITKKGF